MISQANFRKTVVEMLRLASTTIPKDITDGLKRCRRRERNRVALVQFDCMFKSLEIAREFGVPICQDTGIPIFFVKAGSGLRLKFDLMRALKTAVREATRVVPLRLNVADPLTRAISGVNIGPGQPFVHLDFVRGSGLQIDLMLKGGGAANWSRLYMLKPSDGESAIERAVLLTIAEAGGQPCPPTLVGVGVGGSSASACLLAERALLRPLGGLNPERGLAKLEARLTRRANELGIGPMGLGGGSTVLGVHLLKSACHVATLPVAVSFQCWAARRASAKLVGDRLQVKVPR